MNRGGQGAQGPGRADIESWLRTQAGFERCSVRSLEPLEGGYSSATYKVGLTGAVEETAAVLRLEPSRGIFEPYDVLREARVLECLATTRIRVPRVLATVTGRRALGARAVLMEYIDAPHLGEGSAAAGFPGGALRSFTAALADVHAVDWRDAGLGFLGVPTTTTEGFALEVREIARRMKAFGGDREPLLRRALVVLGATVPSAGRRTLCHGDANIFNYLHHDGRVIAVVDWERARIGDPRTDLGQLGALGHLKGAPFGPAGEMPFVGLYEEATGHRLDGLEPFRALWLFHLGVIHHAWVTLHGDEPWFDWPSVSDLLARSLAELERRR